MVGQPAVDDLGETTKSSVRSGSTAATTTTPGWTSRGLVAAAAGRLVSHATASERSPSANNRTGHGSRNAPIRLAPRDPIVVGEHRAPVESAHRPQAKFDVLPRRGRRDAREARPTSTRQRTRWRLRLRSLTSGAITDS
jgi:hypothetical protein